MTNRNNAIYILDNHISLIFIFTSTPPNAGYSCTGMRQSSGGRRDAREYMEPYKKVLLSSQFVLERQN